jgi:hypothetical protein
MMETGRPKSLLPSTSSPPPAYSAASDFLIADFDSDDCNPDDAIAVSSPSSSADPVLSYTAKKAAFGKQDCNRY